MRCSLILVSAVFLCFAIAHSAYAQWLENGNAVCMVWGDQEDPALIPDGSGGTIIVWSDSRGADKDIYCQRIAANGVSQWVLGGKAVCSAAGDQVAAKIVSDGAGGAIIVWGDIRNGVDVDVYAQRIDSGGDIRWTIDGIVVCTDDSHQTFPDLVSDGCGGAIVAWRDYRSEYSDIYAQGIDANGNVLWDAGGVPVCAANNPQCLLCIASDGAGGAVIAWKDFRSDDNGDIYAQRIDPDGTVRWTADGVAICTESHVQQYPQVVTDGCGGAIVTWWDNRIYPACIYTQRIDAEGLVRWGTDGALIYVETYHWESRVIAPDCSGGAYITWSDSRNGGANIDVFAQRMDSTGVKLWAEDGVAVCTAAGNQENPEVCSDGQCGAIITWVDQRNVDRDIYAQRLDEYGAALWTADGISVCNAAGTQISPRITQGGDGGAVFTWCDYRSGDDIDIYASKVDAKGELVATLLRGWVASHTTAGITVEWTLSEAAEDMHFSVFRTECEDRVFDELLSPVIERHALSFLFVDITAEPGKVYRYRVEVEDEEGRRILFETEPILMPAATLVLHQNYPNPFNPITTIEYSIAADSPVELSIYTSSGRPVCTLVDEFKISGAYKITWDGRNDTGMPVASGMYFYRIKAGKESLSRKIIFLR